MNARIAWLASLVVVGPVAAQEPSFVNDVQPILTRFGCNMGACHGKQAGQNGFRLSLRAYAPEWDHGWIVRENGGRRISPPNPEASLLIEKALGKVPHEGGKLIREGGPEHQTLVAWIRAGAPGPRKDDLEVRRVDLLPGSRVLSPNAELQLSMRAEFSDGSTRDVTSLAQFAAGDASVVDVSPAGVAKVLRPGETAVRATYQGQVAVVTLTAPHPGTPNAALYTQKHNVVDEQVFRKLADLRIEPSGPADDATFLRRAFLDTIGVLPTPDEVRAFLADGRADKRSRAIDGLFARPEFVDFWALQLGDLFQNRKESDHDVRGSKGVRVFHEWLRQQVATNRPWDAMARELMTATGSVDEHPAIGYFIVTVGEHRESHKSTVVASAAQTFLGTRIGCAQCHNHPSEKYTQDDYYRFAGFFSRIRLERKEAKTGGTTLLQVSHADKNQNKNPVGVSQPRTNQFLAPRPLDRSEVAIAPTDDPRVALASWMVDPKNEHFAGAMVNRLWAHFMGVGLVEPIDDLRASNPPSNPGLWAALVREFVQSKYDRRHVMRLILESRAYQLSSEPNASNVRDTRFHSRYYARRLSAEVLLDAVSQATGVPEAFEGYPVGIRAVQAPDPTVRSHFLSLFGRSERLTACACERNGEVTLPQLLHLFGGDTVPRKLRSPEGRLRSLLTSTRDDAKLAEELFLLTFSRLPSAEERRAVANLVPPGANAADREEAFRDLWWALFNAKEFAFAH